MSNPKATFARRMRAMRKCSICNDHQAVARLYLTELDGIIRDSNLYCPDCLKETWESTELDAGGTFILNHLKENEERS